MSNFIFSSVGIININSIVSISPSKSFDFENKWTLDITLANNVCQIVSFATFEEMDDCFSHMIDMIRKAEKRQQDEDIKSLNNLIRGS